MKALLLRLVAACGMNKHFKLVHLFGGKPAKGDGVWINGIHFRKVRPKGIKKRLPEFSWPVEFLGDDDQHLRENLLVVQGLCQQLVDGDLLVAHCGVPSVDPTAAYQAFAVGAKPERPAAADGDDLSSSLGVDCALTAGPDGRTSSKTSGPALSGVP